jgi:hypothetical protein
MSLVPFTLTRFLYIREEVLMSLLISVWEKDYDQALFWASELYYSGLEKETLSYIDSIYSTFFRSQNPKLERIMKYGVAHYHKGIQMAASLLLNLTSKKRNFTLKDFVIGNFEPEIKEGAREKETNILIFAPIASAEKYKFDNISHLKPRDVLKHCCVYSAKKQWSSIFGCIFATIPQKELYEKHTRNWLYYAAYCPIWETRIREHCGVIDGEKETVNFLDDDWFEEFHEKYEYELDEQNGEIQNKMLHTLPVKQLTRQDLLKTYEPNYKSRIIKKHK